jgi:hypothetical protein
MFHEPLEQTWVKLLLHPVVQSGSALRILVVHVRPIQRETLGRFEPPPAPAREKGRHAHDDVDASPCVDQQFEVRDVLPPTGGEQSSPGSGRRLGPTPDQEPDQRRVACAGNREKQGGARRCTRRGRPANRYRSRGPGGTSRIGPAALQGGSASPWTRSTQGAEGYAPDGR